LIKLCIQKGAATAAAAAARAGQQQQQQHTINRFLNFLGLHTAV
jgi:hypothetical protein